MNPKQLRDVQRAELVIVDAMNSIPDAIPHSSIVTALVVCAVATCLVDGMSKADVIRWVSDLWDHQAEHHIHRGCCAPA